MEGSGTSHESKMNERYYFSLIEKYFNNSKYKDKVKLWSIDNSS